MDNNIMNWDDVLDNDGQEFIVLPEGDYVFTVTSFERGQFPGGPKIPPCPKATLMLTVDCAESGVAMARVDLMLYRTVEWKIAAFFRCIGLKKHGEKAAMDWSRVVGARGKAHFRPREYTTRDGEIRTVNDVVRFIDFEPSVRMTPVQTDELPWGGFPVAPPCPPSAESALGNAESRMRNGGY